jgi:D-lyxose ketol-isomerase
MTQRASKVTRRNVLTSAAAAAATAVAGRSALAAENCAKAKACAGPEVKTYTNADFYDADGKFLVDKARAAYFDMFERFHNPITETVERDMWILDFGLGDFVNVGMAGILWINRQDYGYFGHEIYLLPGQMIAEHRHMATDKGPAKMESWQPRRGMIYTFGEGEVSDDLVCKIPESQRKIVHSKHCTPLQVDESAHLNRLKAWHFMVGGPEGAIVTEYGTFHDMAGLEFSNPKAKL